jgi:hypothetical protein
MQWNKWIRQFHRWTSIAFTLAFIANIVVMTMEPTRTPDFVTYSPLLPLFLLLLTGLYLFALPYFAKRAGEPAP